MSFKNALASPLHFALGCAILLASLVALPAAAADSPKVKMVTSLGEIVIELNAEKAPKTVENFVQYVNDGFYTGTVFHRVIDGFMIQGGGFDVSMQKKGTRDPIKNEADNGLSNAVGTIAMARTGDPHSATAQFFINTEDNRGSLDHTGKSQTGWGYTVFGKVVEGIEVVRAISTTPTHLKNGMSDVPRDTVLIESASVVE